LDIQEKSYVRYVLCNFLRQIGYNIKTSLCTRKCSLLNIELSTEIDIIAEQKGKEVIFEVKIIRGPMDVTKGFNKVFLYKLCGFNEVCLLHVCYSNKLLSSIEIFRKIANILRENSIKYILVDKNAKPKIISV